MAWSRVALRFSLVAPRSLLRAIRKPLPAVDRSLRHAAPSLPRAAARGRCHRRDQARCAISALLRFDNKSAKAWVAGDLFVDYFDLLINDLAGKSIDGDV